MDEHGTRVQRCWTEPVISTLTDAKAAVAKARASGVSALDGKLLDALRARYDDAVAWGIATNAHRDWPCGRHPGYTLARRLQARAAQVWRFTADFAVPFTSNPAPAHGEAPDEDRRLLAQRPHRRPLLPHPFLPGTARHHGIHPSTPCVTSWPGS